MADSDVTEFPQDYDAWGYCGDALDEEWMPFDLDDAWDEAWCVEHPDECETA